jgi:hypothetical protein
MIWRVVLMYNVQFTVHLISSISETVRKRAHVHTSIHFLLRMTDPMTSQSNDLSSWDTLYSSRIRWCVAGGAMIKLLHYGRKFLCVDEIFCMATLVPIACWKYNLII